MKRGVFTHYLDGLQSRNGSNAQGNPEADWSKTVDAFDAESYAEQEYGEGSATTRCVAHAARRV